MSIQTVSQAFTNEGLGGFSFRNRIINGAMMIDQRNAGALISSVGSGSVYSLDRWLTYDGNSGGHIKIKQNLNSVTPPKGFQNYLGVECISGYTDAASNLTLSQYIEGYNVADLNLGTSNSSPFTLSFWVRSNLTGTFCCIFSDENYTANYIATYTIDASNTWEYKTISIPACSITTTFNTTNSRGLVFRFELNMGSSFSTNTPNTWQASAAYTTSGAQKIGATTGNTFYVTGVQLEKGSAATPFENRPYGMELQLCERYFQRLETGLLARGYNAYGQATTNFPTRMRAAPTVTSGVTSSSASDINVNVKVDGIVIYALFGNSTTARYGYDSAGADLSAEL